MNPTYVPGIVFGLSLITYASYLLKAPGRDKFSAVLDLLSAGFAFWYLFSGVASGQGVALITISLGVGIFFWVRDSWGR